MHLPLFTLFAAALSGVVSAATIHKRQGFTASCSAYTLHGTVLRGTCTTDDGQPETTSLDLNQCIGNDFGGLAVRIF
jgi:type 1 fimbria pilin